MFIWSSYERKFGHSHDTQGEHHLKVKAETVRCTDKQKNTRNYQETTSLGEGHGADAPSVPTEGTNPADAFISDFWHPELWDNTFLLFKPTICGTLLQLEN